MTEIRFRQVETTADTGLLVWGRTEKALFENAAAGLFHIVASPKGVGNAVRKRVRVKEDDLAGRLFAWLSEWLYLFETDGFIGRTFTVDRSAGDLVTGWGYGSIYDPGTHRLLCGVKGVTYHGLEIRRVKDRLRARVILDI
jgi:SHS2 domain-containing protein